MQDDNSVSWQPVRFQNWSSFLIRRKPKPLQHYMKTELYVFSSLVVRVLARGWPRFKCLIREKFFIPDCSESGREGTWICVGHISGQCPNFSFSFWAQNKKTFLEKLQIKTEMPLQNISASMKQQDFDKIYGSDQFWWKPSNLALPSQILQDSKWTVPTVGLL